MLPYWKQKHWNNPKDELYFQIAQVIWLCNEAYNWLEYYHKLNMSEIKEEAQPKAPINNRAKKGAKPD